MKKILLSLLLTFVLVFGLASCGKDNGPQQEEIKFPELELSDYKAYVQNDLAFDFEKLGNANQFAAGVYANAQTAFNNGKAAINAATDINGVKAAYKAAKQAILDAIPSADGLYDFSGLTQAEKTDLTAIIEKYIVATGLTGITLYESGSYVMYNERVTLGTETYIPSYGFGVLAEGGINGPLANETNEAWKEYYHTYETSDPATVNYWNDKGAQVGDLFGYLGGSLFETFMADTKDAYEWVGGLSKDDRPIQVGSSGQLWKVRIKTGADGVKYNTNSTLRADWNGTDLQAQDYITTYQIVLNQHNGLYRGAEAATASGTRLLGIDNYYEMTKDSEGLIDQEAWDATAGRYFKVYQATEEKHKDDEIVGEWYLQWAYNQPVTAFYSMYYIAGSLFTPMPLEFVEEVGLTNLWGFNEDKTETPVDNSLSLGAYTLESWESDKAIVWKKNPYYYYATEKYSIKGIHEVILAGIKDDEDLAVKEFLAGNLDAASLTQNYLKQYKTDPRTRRAVAGSNFKINANTADQATWEHYFGTSGVVAQTAEADYWDLKPVMSNLHFYKALSYALDRNAIADAHGSVPSVSYLGSVYMADAENGISYNTTAQHAEAIKQLTDQTNEGYSLELARDYFRIAIAELEAEGKLTRGTRNNPTVITLQVAWMYPNQEETYHAEVKQMFESAFNHDSVHGGCYELNLEFWAGDVWSDVYYKKLMLGQFDLGFGSISGNSYNILDYLTVLSANQTISGGFTLNWGPNTNDPNQDILVFKGVKWSFDALISAANAASFVDNGKLSEQTAFDVVQGEGKLNEDGSADVSITLKENIEGLDLSFDDLVGFGEEGGTGDYNEDSVLEFDGEDNVTNVDVVNNEDGSVTYNIHISAENVTLWTETYFRSGHEGDLGLDVYVSMNVIEQNGQSFDFNPESGYWGTFWFHLFDVEADAE